MLVPARIIASKKLLDQMDAGVFDQITNVACLPGIQKYAYCMPDGHWGYGFPIGGVAAMDVNEGVISPGGIGFDINCVLPGTRILTRHGFYKPIEEFSDHNEELNIMNLQTEKKSYAKPLLFLRKKSDTKVFKITTLFNQEIYVTADHPLYNGNEMIKASDLYTGSTLVTLPFVGVPYNHVSKKPILKEEDIRRIIGDREEIINELKKRELLPLTLNSPKVPILAKLVGFFSV